MGLEPKTSELVDLRLNQLPCKKTTPRFPAINIHPINAGKCKVFFVRVYFCGMYFSLTGLPQHCDWLGARPRARGVSSTARAPVERGGGWGRKFSCTRSVRSGSNFSYEDS